MERWRSFRLGSATAPAGSVPMFQNIFVPINLADATSWANVLPVAASLAKASEAGLTLGTILPHWVSARDADWSWDADRRLEDVARQRLRCLARQFDCPDCALMMAWGLAPWTVLEMAADCDLIVMAGRKPGLLDRLRSSPAVKVARMAQCSVMVIR